MLKIVIMKQIEVLVIRNSSEKALCVALPLPSPLTITVGGVPLDFGSDGGMDIQAGINAPTPTREINPTQNAPKVILPQRRRAAAQ